MPTGAFLVGRTSLLLGKEQARSLRDIIIVSHTRAILKRFLKVFLFFLKNFFNDSSNAER